MRKSSILVVLMLFAGGAYAQQETMDVPFVGQCTHPTYGDLSSELEWSSSIMGFLFRGAEGSGPPLNPDPPYNPDPSGVGSFALVAGTHVITARCTTPGGVEGTANVTIIVDPTSSPAVIITHPEDGTTYDKEP